jgi:hypothetical protein
VLTQLDGMLLDGLVARRDSRWLRLDELIENIDWLDRWVPNFDEVSYGLPRLIAAGFGEVRGSGSDLRVRATPRAIDLARTSKTRFMGDVVAARPWGEEDAEDWSGGRMPGLDETTWSDAIRIRKEAFDRAMPGPAMQAFIYAVAGVVALVSIVWSRVRRRRN